MLETVKRVLAPRKQHSEGYELSPLTQHPIGTISDGVKHVELTKAQLLWESEAVQEKLSYFKVKRPVNANPASVYGSPGQQVQKLQALIDDRSIDDQLKVRVLNQLTAAAWERLQVYRAIQILGAEKEGRLTEFLEAQRQIVGELAMKFVAVKSSQQAEQAEYVTKLVDHVAENFGFEPKLTTPPSFARGANSSQLTFSDAEHFRDLAEVYLSPEKLQSKLNLEPEQKQRLLACGTQHREKTQPTGITSDREEQQAVAYQPSVFDFYLEKPPAWHAEMEPHIYLPMYEIAIENCKTMADACELAARVLSVFWMEGSENKSHNLLVILFKSKISALQQSAAAGDSVRAYVGGECRFNADKVFVLCKIFDAVSAQTFISALAAAGKVPEDAEVPLTLLPELDSEVLRLLPKRNYDYFYGRYSWEGGLKQLLIKAIAARDKALVAHLLPEHLSLNDDYCCQLLFEAARVDQLDLVLFFFEKYQLSMYTELTQKYPYFGVITDSLFTYACRCGSVQVIRYLMNRYYIDIEKMYSRVKGSSQTYRTSALELALGTNRDDVIALVLSNYDSEDRLRLKYPDDYDCTHCTLLEHACQIGQLSIVKALLPEDSPIKIAELDKLIQCSAKLTAGHLENLKQTLPARAKAAAAPLPVTQEQVRQHTRFYRVRQVEKSARSGDIEALKTWMSSITITDKNILRSLACDAVRGGHVDVAAFLVRLLEEKDMKSLLTSSNFLRSFIIDKYTPKDVYRKLLLTEKLDLTLAEREQILFQLFETNLKWVRPRSDIAEEIARDCHAWMEQGHTLTHFNFSQLNSWLSRISGARRL